MDNESEIIKIGKVSSVGNGVARVTFPDRDDMVSADLPVMQHSTGFAKSYSMPKVGQWVKCTFLATGLEDGFIDGGYYNDEDKPPTTNNAEHGVWFEDGAHVIYNADTKEISISAPGGVNINGLNIGPDGTLTLANGVVVDVHVHLEQGDGKLTGGPQ